MDRRATTPVIGTILMIAVVVILAAAITPYVLDLSETAETQPPQVGFDFDWDNSSRTLTIAHSSGDVLDEGNSERLEVVIWDEDETGINDFDVARGDWAARSNGNFPVTSGETFVITGESGGGDLDVEQAGTNVEDPVNETHEPEVRDVVRLIWYSPEGESSVIARYEIPAGEDENAALRTAGAATSGRRLVVPREIGSRAGGHGDGTALGGTHSFSAASAVSRSEQPSAGPPSVRSSHRSSISESR
jgi:flagellin-like protein